ncbi:MAG: DNA polymerase III subunit delta [Lachnospiraceae bacterium]|nr:DNA polymerase III subunit delta [Lachnospiraceae bacterium]
MSVINDDIKNNSFKTCYLIYGNEEYLKIEGKNKLIKALVNDGDTMNFNTFKENEVNSKAIIDLAETMPFLAEKRVILVEDSGFFKSSDDDMTEYIPNIPESTCLIFVESEVDKRSKTFKAVSKAGGEVNCETPSEQMLTTWVLGKLKRENKNISQNTMNLFFSMTGFDMTRIQSELEKLISYTLHKDVITSEDVLTIVSGQINNRIFEMVEAIGNKDSKKAMGLYNDLLTLKESPMKILSLLTRQFRLIWEINDMASHGEKDVAIAKVEGIPSFAIKKYKAMGRNFTKDDLINGIEEGLSLEESFKKGLINDKMAVEIFISKYAKK